MPYTTENNVRLRNGFYSEENFAEEEALLDEIRLEDRAYSIILLVKNGDTANPLSSPADFTFKPPYQITLTTPAQAGDFFDVLYSTELSSTILSIFLAQATAIVRAHLESQYATSLESWENLDGVPTLIEPAGNPLAPQLINSVTADLAGCEATLGQLRRNETWDDGALTAVRQEKKRIMKMLDQIQDGKLKIEDIDIPLLVDGRGSEFVWADRPVISNIDWVSENLRINRRGAVSLRGAFL